MDNIGKYNLISVKFAKAEQPKFEERKGQGYIQYGANNDYPDYLLNLYKESSKHGAIIKGKSNYIYGKGFNFPKDLMANTQGETFNNIFKKAVKDDELFSGYYLQIIYNLEGKIKDVYHLDFKKVRTNKEQNCFYVKNDWQDNREKARAYPAFSGTYNKDNPSQVLFVKQYNPGDEIYPTPNYYQALNYIESDVQVSRHILGNAKDGFVATTAINLNNGEPNEEQKEQVEKDIKKKFTGSEGDRVLLFFNKSKDTAAEVIPLSQTMLTKEDFTNINNLIQQEIFAGHQITSPMLFGIKTEGQLGGSSEIRDSYEIFNNTYVNERQQQHEEVFNKLLSFKGINGDYKITPVEPLGFNLRDELLFDVMPREYFLDKLGVDQKYYTLPAVRSTGTTAQTNEPLDISGNPIAPVNENLAGMSGRKFQQLERIVRKYKSGKITRQAAAMMLKNSFGINDDEVGLFLDEDSYDSKFAMEDEIYFGGPGSGRTPEGGAEDTDKGEITTESIDKAAEDDRFKSYKNGTPIEKTLDSLTSRGSQVNWDIREGKTSPAIEAYISNVDKSLNSLPDYKGIVYRGVNDNDGGILKSLNENIGNTIEWKGYTHTSRDKEIPGTFGKGVFFTITSKRGKNVESYSSIQSEQEVIFKRNSKFKVNKIEGKNVYITEI